VSAGPRAPEQRLFLALWPTAAERDALLEATAAVIAASAGRAVATVNLHVTLAFLGAVPAGRLGELAALTGKLGADILTPPLLRFTHLEHWRPPQILVALAGEEQAAAAQLAADLKQATAAAGFSPDLKPFRAHVTVARQVNALAGTAQLPPVIWHGATLALVESCGSPAGALYSVLDSWLLGKRENMR
jgi:RNA 2',3'-cyclic 3'-phosphodiesterase